MRLVGIQMLVHNEAIRKRSIKSAKPKRKASSPTLLKSRIITQQLIGNVNSANELMVVVNHLWYWKKLAVFPSAKRFPGRSGIGTTLFDLQ